MVEAERARGVLARERKPLRVQQHLRLRVGRDHPGRTDLRAVGGVAGHDRTVGIRHRIVNGEIGIHERIDEGVVEEWLGAGVVEETQRGGRARRDAVVGAGAERGDEAIVGAAGARVVAQVGGRVDGVFVEERAPVVRVNHLLVGRAEHDAEVAMSAERIEHLGVAEARVGAERVVGKIVVPLRERGEIAAARGIGDASALRLLQRRTGLEVELAAERIGALVGRLARDDFDLLIHRAGERMQRGRAPVATDAGRGHAVDVQARVARGLAANADVVDEVILIGRERDAGQARHEFADVLSRKNTPLVEGGDVFNVGSIPLLRDRERLPLLHRLDRKRLHREHVGRLHFDVDLGGRTARHRDLLARIGKPAVADHEIDDPAGHALENETARAVGEFRGIDRRDGYRGALERIVRARAGHGAGQGARGRIRGERRTAEGGDDGKQGDRQTPKPGDQTQTSARCAGGHSGGFIEERKIPALGVLKVNDCAQQIHL